MRIQDDEASADSIKTQRALTPFHLALPVRDLKKTQTFYQDVLGCTLGRTAPGWIDLNLFDHQLSFHLHPHLNIPESSQGVDGDSIGVPHFGVILKPEDWRQLAKRIKTHQVSFVLPPKVRFQGTAGEQGTYFIRDPQGYLLEFKSFQHMDHIFAQGEGGDEYD